MAVSSSTDFSRTANELVVDALELLGIKGEEEPLQAYELERGLKWLNYMLKAWQAEGVMAWTLTEGSLTLADSDGSYSFAVAGDFTTVPVDILQVRISHDGGSEIEMNRLSREDYYRIPTRTSEGFPTQYYYDRQRDSGTLYVWPEPDDALYDLTFTYRRRIMDMDAGSNNFDLPQEWYDAIVNGLALKLVPIYGKSGTPRAAEIRQNASDAYKVVSGFDVDEGESSIFIGPDTYSSGRW
jgi:hypothetical protein